MAMAGRVVAILSAMLVPTFLLLPFIEASALTRSETGWALFSGADIIVTLAALATMLLVAASFSTADSPLYGAVILGLGAFVLGHMLPEEIDPARLIGIGAILVNVAAAGMIAGGTLMLLASVGGAR
jgi:hypothetical protein